MLPTSKPSLGKEELKRIAGVLSSGWLGMGSLVLDFENELKKFIGAKYAVAVNTGTSAIHIALDSLGLEPGSEVIVPSLTFVGSLQPVILCGLKPVFCDIYEDTLNINVEDALEKITKKTKVIMPVHYSGLPCRMDEIMRMAKIRHITVLEDAAHAFGSFYKGRKIGTLGDVTCFSFDPIKNITCGEGGAVVTDNRKIAEKVVKKRILGISKDTWHRYRNSRSWIYEVTMSGFRYHMSNINAAIGIEQLKKVDKFMRKKRQISMKYDEAFRKIKDLEVIIKDYDSINPFNYIIKIKSGNRARLIEFLKNNGIGTGVHYIPNHLQPFFAKYKTRLPLTEKVWKEILTLPLFYDMTDSDVDLVIKKVRAFFRS